MRRTRKVEAPALVGRQRCRSWFTLVEIMIVVAIIGLLAAIAIPAYAKARMESQKKTCQQHQIMIYNGITEYCMDHDLDMKTANWGTLSTARDRLAPGDTALYLKSWAVFDCPVKDSQDRLDYSFFFDTTTGEMTAVPCNNSNGTAKALHNAP